eukprot:4012532-Pleurochrysis_carterae.AAC.1
MSSRLIRASLTDHSREQSSLSRPSPARCVATNRRGAIQAPPGQAAAHVARPPRYARVAWQKTTHRPRPLIRRISVILRM